MRIRKLLTMALACLLVAGWGLLSRHHAEARRRARDLALVEAVSEGDLERAGTLLQAGANLRMRTDLEESLVIAADNARSPELVELLARRGLSPHERDSTGLTVLHRAARRGDTRMLETVLDLGQSVEEPDAQGRTALTHALRGGQLNAARLLLEHGASVGADPSGVQPLFALIASDANPRLIGKSRSLIWPVKGARPPGVSAAMTTSPRQDLLRAYRSQPFSAETENAEWVALVRALLARGADPAVRDAEGQDAVEIALARGLGKTARLLVEKQGGWRDAQGRTALRIAAEQGHLAEVAELYSMPGRPSEGPGAELLLASWMGDRKRAQSLLASGADPNRSAIPGRTVLMGACRRRDLPLLKLLLSRGARPQQAEAGGNTPLHSAASYLWLEGASALVAAGAPVNARNEFGATPLHLAVGSRGAATQPAGARQIPQGADSQLAIVRLLLTHGADPNAADCHGYTPLQTALRSPGESNRTLVRMLLKHGARAGGHSNGEG